MTQPSETPWTWHPTSIDQAHTGSVYRMERPGHAYAIAMQPRYVSNEQWAADAALIVKAVNSHDCLVDLVRTLIQNDPAEPIADNGMVVIDKWRDDARKFLASIGEKT